MKIEIDLHSGFCTGVRRAVKLAEDGLKESKELLCLGDIVHNQAEVARLSQSGLITLPDESIEQYPGSNILIRAHGEPPSTYERLEKGKNKIIDGTCPVVIQVQKKLKKAFEERNKTGGNIIIYGKYSHPEVIGLLGQINGQAITVVSTIELQHADFSKPVYLFSQTTMPMEGFKEIQEYIKKRMEDFFPTNHIPLNVYDTICRQVANRVPQLKEFTQKYQVIIFVGGLKSSNGKILFQACLESNPRSHFVSELAHLQKEWFQNVDSVGICGATSTPLWQMEEISEQIRKLV
jgi:4-hydroxy-3-methylbut-2-en-1-yl diphosphate reductase